MDFACTPIRLATLIEYLRSGKITSPMAKKIFAIIEKEDKDVDAIIEAHGFRALGNEEISKHVDQVFAEHEDVVAKILAGNDRGSWFFDWQGDASDQRASKPCSTQFSD